jgi:hypothetical protein
MASVVKVFGGLSGTALDWPQLVYTGDWLRRITEYGGIWYYEYMLLNGGTLTAARSYVCDVFLVGGGGQGAASPSTGTYAYPSPGGGSGYPAFSLGRTLGEGDHAVAVSTAAAASIALDTTIVAEKGGNASAAASSSSVGSGFTGTYYLYGDTEYPAGTGGGATRGSGSPTYVTPGTGGGGCTMKPNVRPGPAFKRPNGATRNWGPVVPGYSGYGAGAMGRTASADIGDSSYAAWTTTPAPGLVCVRIAVQ